MDEVALFNQARWRALAEAEPGTWDHFVSIAPPWLIVWCTYQPA